MDFEVKLLKELKYCLYLISPYGYLEELSIRLSLEENDYFIIEAAIDYVLSLTDFINLEPQQIFGICFIVCFENRCSTKLKLFQYMDIFFRKYPGIREKSA